jgi:predicted RND superfamily exporter protein
MNWIARGAVLHPRLWFAAGIAVTLALAAGLPRLELKTDGESLQPDGNAVVARSDADRIRFEEPRHLVLLVRCADPGCLATPTALRFLSRIHNEVESLPAVRSDGVRSVASLVHIERRGGRLSLEPYLDRIPESDAEIAELITALREHPLTNGLLFSRDARLASFFVPLAEDRPVSELVEELARWRDSIDEPEYELLLSGPELAEATLGAMVLRDLSVLVPAMLVVVCILLYLTLGSPAGVLIPMAEAGMVLLWTFGTMGWLGVPVTLVTTILPVVLMAMAITDEIHLLERVARQDPSRPRGEAVLAALDQVGRPIILTSVTTALGFLSFLSASIQPMREFGLFAAFGILAAMWLTFGWIPALIVLIPETWTQRTEQRFRAPSRVLEALGSASIRRPTAALTAGIIFLLASIPGVLMLRVQDSWIDNFDPDSEIVRAERAFNDAFWGSYRYDVVLEAPPDFFYSSHGTRLVEELEEIAGSVVHVGGVESHLTLLAEVARAVGEAPPLSRLPELAVADLAILAEMSAERMTLRRLLTEPGDAARVRLYVNSPDYARSAEVRSQLDERLESYRAPGLVTLHVSGDLPVALEVVAEIVGNQLRSIGWALLTVGLVLIAFFGRGLTGLVALVPVSTATLFVLGGMGFLDVPLGIATSMFASLTVGVGVDFGIHFLYRYRRERAAGSSDAEALVATGMQTGVALRWNALVLALGFVVLSLSSLKPNHSLGFLLAAAMLACYVATLIFLPRLARLATVLAAAVIVSGAAAPEANAGDVPCSRPADSGAQTIMASRAPQHPSGFDVLHRSVVRPRSSRSVAGQAAGSNSPELRRKCPKSLEATSGLEPRRRRRLRVRAPEAGRLRPALCDGGCRLQARGACCAPAPPPIVPLRVSDGGTPHGERELSLREDRLGGRQRPPVHVPLPLRSLPQGTRRDVRHLRPGEARRLSLAARVARDGPLRVVARVLPSLLPDLRIGRSGGPDGGEPRGTSGGLLRR